MYFKQVDMCGQRAAEGTLILDTSMVHPIETMVMNKTTIKSRLMVLSIAGAILWKEVALSAVALNKTPSFCHKSGSENESAV